MHSFLAFIILLLVLVLNFGMSYFYLTVFFLYLFEQAELGNEKAVYFHAKKKNANGEQAESSCLVYIRSFNMLWYTAVSSSE